MLITEISAKECEEILDRNGFGRLGCSRGDQPYVVPIYFAFQR
ncbi:MAG: pyridoxamine 5'-phosphate oxidase family protein, partial [Candidatus Acidiferrales bacterium]